MVAFHDRAAERAHNFEAFPRIGVIAHDVADADSVGHRLRLHILQHGFESFQVAVDIAKNAKSHGRFETRWFGKWIT